MSVPLTPVITRAGLAAVANAQGTGLQAVIDRISVGRGTLQAGVYKGYAPDNTATALKGEMARVPILSGARRDPSGFTVLSVLPPSPDAVYPINEVGFHLTDGTLFALWSDAVYPLAYSTTLASVELGFDLILDAIPASALNIAVLMPDVPDTAGALALLLSCETRSFIKQLNAEKRAVARGIY